MKDPAWINASQELPFPDWIPRDTRAKIRATIIDLPAEEDDDADCGLVVLPPSSDLNTGMCITSKRIARAFKQVLGDSCGTPPAENIQFLIDLKEEL